MLPYFVFILSKPMYYYYSDDALWSVRTFDMRNECLQFIIKLRMANTIVL